MQKSEDSRAATTAHRKVKSSTTLNRKYVRRPSKSPDGMIPVKRSSKIKRFDVQMIEKENKAEQKIAPATVHPIQKTAIKRMQNRSQKPVVSKMTAKELKDQAIKKALADAAKMKEMNDEGIESKDVSKKMHFGVGRVVLALSCAAVAVLAIVYFVNLNMPDISIRVAAMQTGIEASFPSYVPKEFNVSSIMSEDGKVVISFRDNENDKSFSLTEESSSWDSSALLNNFVKNEYGEDYAIIKEQGLTIYIGNSGAAWVNGGMMYKINATEDVLSKKQISSIATSL